MYQSRLQADNFGKSLYKFSGSKAFDRKNTTGSGMRYCNRSEQHRVRNQH